MCQLFRSSVLWCRILFVKHPRLWMCSCMKYIQIKHLPQGAWKCVQQTTSSILRLDSDEEQLGHGCELHLGWSAETYNCRAVILVSSSFPAGLAPRGGVPQYAAVLAPDLLAVGATVLVPAQTLPDRQVSFVMVPKDLLYSDSRSVGVPAFPDQLEFLLTQISWTRKK